MRKSKEKKEFNLKEILGEGVKIKESRKSILKKDRQFFIDLVTSLADLDDRTDHLVKMGIDLMTYEDPYHNIIEGFIFKHYGNVEGEIVMWWLSEKRLPKEKDMVIQDHNGIDHPVNTPIQLYNMIKRVTKLVDNA